jgi:hypothetical protein
MFDESKARRELKKKSTSELESLANGDVDCIEEVALLAQDILDERDYAKSYDSTFSEFENDASRVTFRGYGLDAIIVP